MAARSLGMQPPHRCSRVACTTRKRCALQPPPDMRWKVPMRYLVRVAFAVLSLATITPVANAAVFHNGSTIADDGAATLRQQNGGFAGGGN